MFINKMSDSKRSIHVKTNIFAGPLAVDLALWINVIGDIDEKNMVSI